MRGISTIFSTLLVTVIILSFFVPLLLYYNSINQQNGSAIMSLINQGKESLEVKITLIRIGNSSDKIYLYNYGNINIEISQIIINKTIFSVNYTLSPNSIARLSNIIGNFTIPTNQSLIIKLNDMYYIFS